MATLLNPPPVSSSPFAQSLPLPLPLALPLPLPVTIQKQQDPNPFNFHLGLHSEYPALVGASSGTRVGVRAVTTPDVEMLNVGMMGEEQEKMRRGGYETQESMAIDRGVDQGNGIAGEMGRIVPVSEQLKKIRITEDGHHPPPPAFDFPTTTTVLSSSSSYPFTSSIATSSSTSSPPLDHPPSSKSSPNPNNNHITNLNSPETSPHLSSPPTTEPVQSPAPSEASSFFHPPDPAIIASTQRRHAIALRPPSGLARELGGGQGQMEKEKGSGMPMIMLEPSTPDDMAALRGSGNGNGATRAEGLRRSGEGIRGSGYFLKYLANEEEEAVVGRDFTLVSRPASPALLATLPPTSIDLSTPKMSPIELKGFGAGSRSPSMNYVGTRSKSEALMGLSAAEMGLLGGNEIGENGKRVVSGKGDAGEKTSTPNWKTESEPSVSISLSRRPSHIGLGYRHTSSGFGGSAYIPEPPTTFADRKIMIISSMEDDTEEYTKSKSMLVKRGSGLRLRKRGEMEGRGGGVPVGAGKRSKTRLGLAETEDERKAREGESVIAWKVWAAACVASNAIPASSIPSLPRSSCHVNSITTSGRRPTLSLNTDVASSRQPVHSAGSSASGNTEIFSPTGSNANLGPPIDIVRRGSQPFGSWQGQKGFLPDHLRESSPSRKSPLRQSLSSTQLRDERDSMEMHGLRMMQKDVGSIASSSKPPPSPNRSAYGAENAFLSLRPRLASQVIRTVLLELVHALAAYGDARAIIDKEWDSPDDELAIATIAAGRRAWSRRAMDRARNKGLIENPTLNDCRFQDSEARALLQDLDDTVGYPGYVKEMLIRGRYTVADIVFSIRRYSDDDDDSLQMPRKECDRMLLEVEELLWGGFEPSADEIPFGFLVLPQEPGSGGVASRPAASPHRRSMAADLADFFAQNTSSAGGAQDRRPSLYAISPTQSLTSLHHGFMVIPGVTMLDLDNIQLDLPHSGSANTPIEDFGGPQKTKEELAREGKERYEAWQRSRQVQPLTVK